MHTTRYYSPSGALFFEPMPMNVGEFKPVGDKMVAQISQEIRLFDPEGTRACWELGQLMKAMAEG